MKNNIKVIFADLFGVLIGPNYSNLINYIQDITKEKSDIIYKLVFDEDSMNFIRGEISFNQYFRGVKYKFKNGNHLEKEKFHTLWHQMQMGEMPTVTSLFKIKEKYKLFIITNTTAAHIKKIKQKFLFIDNFDGIITSDIANAHKPTIEIFNYACKVANVIPEEAIFIDDSYANVMSALDLGMTSHQYKSYAEFLNFINEY